MEAPQESKKGSSFQAPRSGEGSYTIHGAQSEKAIVANRLGQVTTSRGGSRLAGMTAPATSRIGGLGEDL